MFLQKINEIAILQSFNNFSEMKNIPLSFFLAGIVVFSANAQHSLFENWSAGINAGLYGVGVSGCHFAFIPFQTEGRIRLLYLQL